MYAKEVTKEAYGCLKTIGKFELGSAKN